LALRDSFAFCNLCHCDVNVAHGGHDDLRKHCTATQKHLNAASLSSFAGADRSAKVTHSELLFASFLVEHSIPLSTSDHASPLFRNIFPDSELEKKHGSARTKTSSMISVSVDSSQSNVVIALARQLIVQLNGTIGQK